MGVMRGGRVGGGGDVRSGTCVFLSVWVCLLDGTGTTRGWRGRMCGCTTHDVDHNTRLHRAEPRQQYRASQREKRTKKENGDVKRRNEGRTWFAYSRSCCPRSADTLPSCVCAYWFSSRRKSSSSNVGGNDIGAGDAAHTSLHGNLVKPIKKFETMRHFACWCGAQQGCSPSFLPAVPCSLFSSSSSTVSPPLPPPPSPSFASPLCLPLSHSPMALPCPPPRTNSTPALPLRSQTCTIVSAASGVPPSAGRRPLVMPVRSRWPA